MDGRVRMRRDGDSPGRDGLRQSEGDTEDPLGLWCGYLEMRFSGDAMHCSTYYIHTWLNRYPLR